MDSTSSKQYYNHPVRSMSVAANSSSSSSALANMSVAAEIPVNDHCSMACSAANSDKLPTVSLRNNCNSSTFSNFDH